MRIVDRISLIVSRWESLGTRQFASGCRLIGHIPFNGPQAYLHRIKPPLSEEHILKFEEALGLELPAELKDFYRQANGMNLFFGRLPVFGYRTSWDRADDEAMHCQPFAAVRLRPRNLPSDLIEISRYEDLSLVCIDPRGRISRHSNETFAELNSWPSFELWLETEARRMASLFNDAGHCMISEADTPPAPEITQ